MRWVKFWLVAILAFEVVTRPFRYVLVRLCKRTGWSSARFTRLSIHVTALVAVWEIAWQIGNDQAWVTPISVLVMAMGVPWALRRVERMEKALSGDAVYEYLTDADIKTLVIWSLIYSFSGAFTLPMFFVDGDPFPIKAVGIVVVSAWLVLPIRKRPKEKRRVTVPVPVPT